MTLLELGLLCLVGSSARMVGRLALAQELLMDDNNDSTNEELQLEVEICIFDR